MPDRQLGLAVVVHREVTQALVVESIARGAMERALQLELARSLCLSTSQWFI